MGDPSDYDCTFVGCGPVGCLMAALLRCHLGLNCEIWEKRTDPRLSSNQGKSINLSLSCRGLYALTTLPQEDLQLLSCLRQSVPTPGRAIHKLNQPLVYQPYSEIETLALHSVNRGQLNTDLLNIAEKNGVKIRFGQSLQKVDFDRKVATFQNMATNELHEVPYNTLWGTDGSNSAIRPELEKLHGEPGKTYKYEAGYKEFELKAGNGGEFRLNIPQAVHVWPRSSQTFFIAIPNADGSFTCTLFSPSSGPECVGNFDDQQLLDLFKTQFPDLYEIIGPDNLLSNHRQNPFSSLFNVETPNWHFKGDAVIVGDSAFGVVPYYGMGINACMESCRHLFNLVKLHRNGNKSYNWHKIFSEFNKLKPHLDVLRLQSLRNAVELHRKVDSPHFLFMKDVERELQRRFPKQFVEAHSLLSFTNIPMVAAGEQIRIQEMIAKQICDNKTTMEEIDFTEAEQLIKKYCCPDLFKERLWYESTPAPNNYTEVVKYLKTSFFAKL